MDAQAVFQNGVHPHNSSHADDDNNKDAAADRKPQGCFKGLVKTSIVRSKGITMNRQFAIAAVLAVAATSALADDITVDTTPFVSGRTRAEVQAELGNFQKAGTSPWSIQYNPLKSFASSTTRSQAQAEYIASRDQVRALTGEDSGSAYLAQGGSFDSRTRLAGHPAAAAQ